MLRVGLDYVNYWGLSELLTRSGFCVVHGVKLGCDKGDSEVVRLVADSYPEGVNIVICSFFGDLS